MTLLISVERASLIATSDQLGNAMLCHLTPEASTLSDFLFQLLEVDYRAHSPTAAPKEFKAPGSILATVPALKELYALALGCPPSQSVFQKRKAISASLRSLLFDPAKELGLPYSVVVARVWQYWSYLSPDLIYRGSLNQRQAHHGDEELANRINLDRALVSLLVPPMMEQKRQHLYAAINAAWKDLLRNRPQTNLTAASTFPFPKDDPSKTQKRTKQRRERRARQRLREDQEDAVYDAMVQREREKEIHRGYIMFGILLFLACFGLLSIVCLGGYAILYHVLIWSGRVSRAPTTNTFCGYVLGLRSTAWCLGG